ncbi:cobalt-precorrin-6A reductase [Flexivirga meconopsidis]|uniref:cobalt-precorrin-6A reductase n=1 Tax=Flexivirga meconopsidis TaxID=2977121 RepID=UPI00223ED758
MRVLVLGGTAEARALAEILYDGGHDLTSSLAGRVASPRLPVGQVRIGGFGGVTGMRDYLTEHRVEAVVDATHPFATGMRENARKACAESGIALIRLARPGWAEHPDAHTWHWADDYDAAREKAERWGQRPFLTTGRQTLPFFTSAWAGREVLLRVVDPDVEVPTAWRVVHDRGPYVIPGEVALMRQHRVDVLLTKDSGGSYTAAKLAAAAQLGVPVVVVRRPAQAAGVTTVDSPEAAAAAIALLPGA